MLPLLRSLSDSSHQNDVTAGGGCAWLLTVPHQNLTQDLLQQSLLIEHSGKDLKETVE